MVENKISCVKHHLKNNKSKKKKKNASTESACVFYWTDTTPQRVQLFFQHECVQFDQQRHCLKRGTEIVWHQKLLVRTPARFNVGTVSFFVRKGRSFKNNFHCAHVDDKRTICFENVIKGRGSNLTEAITAHKRTDGDNTNMKTNCQTENFATKKKKKIISSANSIINKWPCNKKEITEEQTATPICSGQKCDKTRDFWKWHV